MLGAARISELSIIGPAAGTGSRLVAVAARDRDRAETVARTHGIERVHESYTDVIADPLPRDRARAPPCHPRVIVKREDLPELLPNEVFLMVR